MSDRKTTNGTVATLPQIGEAAPLATSQRHRARACIWAPDLLDDSTSIQSATSALAPSGSLTEWIARPSGYLRRPTFSERISSSVLISNPRDLQSSRTSAAINSCCQLAGGAHSPLVVRLHLSPGLASIPRRRFRHLAPAAERTSASPALPGSGLQRMNLERRSRTTNLWASFRCVLSLAASAMTFPGNDPSVGQSRVPNSRGRNQPKREIQWSAVIVRSSASGTAKSASVVKVSLEVVSGKAAKLRCQVW